VSILDRLRLSAHLDDAGLAAIWTDESTSGVRQAHPHLEGCAICRARFAELSDWLQNVRSEAVSEADAHFPAERLAAQQALIFRRLEAAERRRASSPFPDCAAVDSRTSHVSLDRRRCGRQSRHVGVG
jgi:hypothetical protein